MTSMFRNVLVILSASVAISGCATQQNASSPKNTIKNDALYGTYMFVSKCPSLERKKAAFGGEIIAGAIAAEAVKAGIDILGRAIKKAATDEIDRTTVVSNITSIQSLEEQCINIIRAKFSFASATDLPNTPNAVIVSETGALSGTKYTPAEIKVVDAPDLHIILLPIVQNKTVTFVPLSLEYSGKTPSDPKKRKDRELSLVVGFSTIDKDASKDTFSARVIDFGLIKVDDKNTKLNFIDDNGAIFSANQTQLLKFDTTENFSFAATIIETKRAGKMAKFWDTVFSESQEELKTAAETAVKELEIFKTREQIEQAKWTKQEAKNTAKSQYYSARQLVTTKTEALEQLCSTGTPKESAIFKAQTELFDAINAANLKKEQAEVGGPPLEVVTPTGKCS